MQTFIPRPQYPTPYRRLNDGLGAHLDQVLQGSVVRPGHKAAHKHPRIEVGPLALRSFKDQCQNQTVLVATDNSTVVAYLHKQGGTHSAEMCALLWNIMTWCHHYHITLKARHIPGCLNVMTDILSRSNQGHSTEWPLICHSSEPQRSTVRISCPRPKCLGHRCSEHKLDGSHCLRLPSDGSPSQGDPKSGNAIA